MNPELRNKIKSVILGHAVADALGVPAEFRSRESLEKDPITDMVGFGTYPYPAGCWSDDTSMTLAALDSLAGGRLDDREIMDNFAAWCYRDQYTPTGTLFDIGGTCRAAIHRYAFQGCAPETCGCSEKTSNGNGSLMRILPFVLFGEYGRFHGDFLTMIHRASALTHAHPRSQVGCGLYALAVSALLRDPCKESLLQGLRLGKIAYGDHPELRVYSRLFRKEFPSLEREKIKSSGYVVDTLEAALWCVLTTDRYDECVLKAVNLGEDTDTVAAVAGGLAGALYGWESIPETWLSTLKRRDDLEALCDRACATWSGPDGDGRGSGGSC